MLLNTPTLVAIVIALIGFLTMTLVFLTLNHNLEQENKMLKHLLKNK